MIVIKQERRGDIHFLELEASVAQLNSAMDGAFKKLVKTARIPGFRQGKVPRTVFEKHYGQESIVREGVMDVVNDLYSRAVQDLELKVIDYPKNLQLPEYKPNESLIFSLEVDVVPEVKLGNYKGLNVKKESTDVTEDEVQAAIDELRQRHADYKLVDTEVREKAILSCKVAAELDGTVYEKWTRDNMGVEVGRATLGKEFDAQLLGKKSGDSFEFDVNFPENAANPEIAGKKVHFAVEILEVRALEMPEVTPEFVEKVSAFKTVEDFVADQRVQLENKKKQSTEDAFHNQILDEIFKTTEVVVPNVMIERAIDQFVDEMEANLKRSGIPLDRYLGYTGKKIEDVRKEYHPGAERKVKTELVLDTLVKAEGISVSQENLIEEIKTWKGPDQEPFTDEQVQQFMAGGHTEGFITLLSRRKAMAVVIDNLKK